MGYLFFVPFQGQGVYNRKPRLNSTGNFLQGLTQTGINVSKDIPTNGMWMIGTAVTYLVIQIPAYSLSGYTATDGGNLDELVLLLLLLLLSLSSSLPPLFVHEIAQKGHFRHLQHHQGRGCFPPLTPFSAITRTAIKHCGSPSTRKASRFLE
jgi:hypothetical protein